MKRAAQYVRMSTDLQRYSIENQSDAIAAYAAQRGFIVVRSYDDAGKSGVKIDGRDALKTLIDDVTSGKADFETVLVYDVSRWGRFQDCDESAYYEFVCKEAGVSVEYCAEQFENDGSFTATLLKNIKRLMAGEYSRELSTKVFRGQSRVVKLGFRAGGVAGYGYRRAMVDEKGNIKCILNSGERKSLQTDRVILVRGPREEVEIVRKIHRAFVEERKNFKEIARALNAGSIRNSLGQPWTQFAIKKILTNEKYIGNNLYNRTSSRLGGKWRAIEREHWVRAEGVFQGIVSKEIFAKAKLRIEQEYGRYTRAELLDTLTALWCKHGKLNSRILKATNGAPEPCTYIDHFHSMMNAYHLIGYRNKQSLSRRIGNQNRRDVLQREMLAAVSERGGGMKLFSGNRLCLINDEFSVAVKLLRMSQSQYWRLSYFNKVRPDFLVVGRVEPISENIRDYFVLPLVLTPKKWITFPEGIGSPVDSYRFSTLEVLYDLCKRVPLDSIGSVTGSIAEKFGSEKDARAIRKWERQEAVSTELNSAVQRLRAVLSAGDVVRILHAEGVHTIPAVLFQLWHKDQWFDDASKSGCPPDGLTILSYIVVWKWFSKLNSNNRIKCRLTESAPHLVQEWSSGIASLASSQRLGARNSWKQ